MDLKGAKIRNIYQLCNDINVDGEKELNTNIPF